MRFTVKELAPENTSWIRALDALAHKTHTGTMFSKHKLASRDLRLYAKLIDWALNGVIMLIMIIALSIMTVGFAMVDIADMPWLVLVVAIAVIALFLLNAAQWILIAMRGQTIGKILMHIRIVDARTHKIPTVVRSLLLRTWLNSCLNSSGVYFLVDVLLIFREDRRCIHDFIAGTIVRDT
ncbi:hypothetical protein COU80_05100 [Candidatus Peregrinibacteria bacterium CG10_big_fil_rev_8_21_14_0_10_55_24]|nr:MAG: hypothetical protein COU80_05100 [Candidatus Peregrinibacteria bacterium CG10_big_fil_rev_8_21_14_0_10_55_24]